MPIIIFSGLTAIAITLYFIHANRRARQAKPTPER